MKSLLVIGFGDTALRAPDIDLFEIVCKTIPSRSSSAIQLIYCFPEPILPPIPILEGPNILLNIPPDELRTRPILIFKTRIPDDIAFSVASSHSRQTSGKKPSPGLLSSDNTSPPGHHNNLRQRLTPVPLAVYQGILMSHTRILLFVSYYLESFSSSLESIFLLYFLQPN